MHNIAVASKKRMVVDGERGFPPFQFYRQFQLLPASFANFLPAILMIWREVTRAGNLKSPRGTSHIYLSVAGPRTPSADVSHHGDRTYLH